MTTDIQRNVDDNEIAKFSQIAEKWWDKTANSNLCTTSIRCAWVTSMA